MVKEFDVVALKADLPKRRLLRGDVGTAVHVHPDGTMEVEFVTFGGDTVALLHLCATQIRRVGKKDLLHARLLGTRKTAGRTRPPNGRQPVKKLRAG